MRIRVALGLLTGREYVPSFAIDRFGDDHAASEPGILCGDRISSEFVGYQELEGLARLKAQVPLGASKTTECCCFGTHLLDDHPESRINRVSV